MPPRQPTTAGIAAWPVYAPRSGDGREADALEYPDPAVAGDTAPLTTLVTISADITMPMTPKAIRNGTNGAMLPVSAQPAAS